MHRVHESEPWDENRCSLCMDYDLGLIEGLLAGISWGCLEGPLGSLGLEIHAQGA